MCAEGETTLRFVARRGETAPPESCVVQSAAAKTVLRMICARLGVVCKERTNGEISPYGDRAVFDGARERTRWSVSFHNTPDRQDFVIETV